MYTYIYIIYYTYIHWLFFFMNNFLFVFCFWNSSFSLRWDITGYSTQYLKYTNGMIIILGN